MVGKMREENRRMYILIIHEENQEEGKSGYI